MASFNVFVMLSLHVLLLVSSSATRPLHPLSVPQQAIEDEVKATSPLEKFASRPHHSEQLTKAASVTSAIVKTNESKEFLPHQANEDEVKATSPLKKFASLPHHSKQLTKAASVTSETVKTNESKEFRNGKNKSALTEEDREAIKASMKRNIGNPFELKRLSLVVLILIITDDLIARFVFMVSQLEIRAIPHHAIEDEVKETSLLKKFASIPHHSEQLTKAAFVTSATVKTNESM
ncbi:hypothetical protein V6N13_081982 [Hibiscus sabdariffa]